MVFFLLLVEEMNKINNALAPMRIVIYHNIILDVVLFNVFTKDLDGLSKD